MGKNIPDRWESYKPIGKPIKGTRFIAFKVPLRKSFYDHANNKFKENWLDCDILLENVPNLGLIIDLTNTRRYYNPLVFKDQGVSYLKIMLRGRQLPTARQMTEFQRGVEKFLTDNRDNDKLIGVHCTHGINRTGYLICHHMVTELNMSADYAIGCFETARGHKIERSIYLNAIRTACLKINSYGKNILSRYSSDSVTNKRQDLNVGCKFENNMFPLSFAEVLKSQEKDATNHNKYNNRNEGRGSNTNRDELGDERIRHYVSMSYKDNSTRDATRDKRQEEDEGKGSNTNRDVLGDERIRHYASMSYKDNNRRYVVRDKRQEEDDTNHNKYNNRNEGNGSSTNRDELGDKRIRHDASMSYKDNDRGDVARDKKQEEDAISHNKYNNRNERSGSSTNRDELVDGRIRHYSSMSYKNDNWRDVARDKRQDEGVINQNKYINRNERRGSNTNRDELGDERNRHYASMSYKNDNWRDVARDKRKDEARYICRQDRVNIREKSRNNRRLIHPHMQDETLPRNKYEYPYSKGKDDGQKTETSGRHREETLKWNYFDQYDRTAKDLHYNTTEVRTNDNQVTSPHTNRYTSNWNRSATNSKGSLIDSREREHLNDVKEEVTGREVTGNSGSTVPQRRNCNEYPNLKWSRSDNQDHKNCNDVNEDVHSRDEIGHTRKEDQQRRNLEMYSNFKWRRDDHSRNASNDSKQKSHDHNSEKKSSAVENSFLGGAMRFKLNDLDSSFKRQL